MTAICLAMIVRDEAHVIERCIQHVRPFIDSWAIVDTGSTDDTEEVAKHALRGIPGQYAHATWEGYGPSRTRSIRLAEDVCRDKGFALIVDADDIWSGTRPEELGGDLYAVRCRRSEGAPVNLSSRLFRLGAGLQYVGPVHEHPAHADGSLAIGQVIDCLQVMSPPDGASWKDPDKYLKHARLLSEALVNDPANTRYAFYLAQSYRDAHDDKRAAKLYLARANMGKGDDPEEVYISYLEAGRALLRLGHMDDARAVLLKAHQSYPARREACAELARVFALKAALSPPEGRLFVEPMEHDDEMREAAA